MAMTPAVHDGFGYELIGQTTSVARVEFPIDYSKYKFLLVASCVSNGAIVASTMIPADTMSSAHQVQARWHDNGADNLAMIEYNDTTKIKLNTNNSNYTAKVYGISI